MNTTIALNQMYEHQMKWILKFDSGEAELPYEAKMRREIDAKKKWIMPALWWVGAVHLEEPHLFDFPELEQSIREGKARAKGNSYPASPLFEHEESARTAA